MSSKGYVSIHRALMDHWLWESKPFSRGQAWIDLILLANYKDAKFTYNDQVIDGKRGTVYRSVTWLSNRWDWSRDKVTRYLDNLEADGMIRQSKTTHLTAITLVNYGRYQDSTTANKATSRQQTGNKSATDRQQADTYNKDNNYSIIKNKEKEQEAVFIQQSEKEIKDATDWFNNLEEE